MSRNRLRNRQPTDKELLGYDPKLCRGNERRWAKAELATAREALKASTGEPYCPECGSRGAQGTGTHHFCFNHDDGDGCVDFEWDPNTGCYLDPKTRKPVADPKDSVF